MKQHGCGGAVAAILWMASAACGSDANTSTGGMTAVAPAAGGTSAVPSTAAGSKATAGAAPAAPAGAGTAAPNGGSPAAVGAAGTGVAVAGTAGAGGSGSTLGAAGAKAAAGAGAMPAAGCGTESFAAIYQSILMNPIYNCVGALCHGRDAANAASVGNLSLSSAAVAYMQLVKKASDGAVCSGKTRVVPGDPANSLFVQKLRGQSTMCGAPMPVNADEITDAELKRITDWISAGACDN